MRSPAPAALTALLALALVAPMAAGQGSGSAGAGVGAGGGPEVTVLLFHPSDGVDPLGFPAPGEDIDAFTLRYAPLVADKGRFDFPYFVADGVLPIEAIPDSAKPFASALAAYETTVQQRAAEEPAATLRLASLAAGTGQVVLQVTVEPRADLAGEDLHLRVALVEDHVEYQPPPGLTNGVTDHRFTVRGYADLGPVDGRMDAAHTFRVLEGQKMEEMSVAAWLQQDAGSPRFDPREVVQATHAAVGDDVVQAGKGVLVEMLSATWCDPCLYGDRAVEQLAIDHGVATASSREAGARYLDLRARDAVALAVAAVIGAAVAMLARRRA